MSVEVPSSHGGAHDEESVEAQALLDVPPVNGSGGDPAISPKDGRLRALLLAGCAGLVCVGAGIGLAHAVTSGSRGRANLRGPPPTFCIGACEVRRCAGYSEAQCSAEGGEWVTEPPDKESCSAAARAAGLSLGTNASNIDRGGKQFGFTGDYGAKGCYTYQAGDKYFGAAFWEPDGQAGKRNIAPPKRAVPYSPTCEVTEQSNSSIGGRCVAVRNVTRKPCPCGESRDSDGACTPCELPGRCLGYRCADGVMETPGCAQCKPEHVEVYGSCVHRSEAAGVDTSHCKKDDEDAVNIGLGVIALLLVMCVLAAGIWWLSRHTEIDPSKEEDKEGRVKKTDVIKVAGKAGAVAHEALGSYLAVSAGAPSPSTAVAAASEVGNFPQNDTFTTLLSHVQVTALSLGLNFGWPQFVSDLSASMKTWSFADLWTIFSADCVLGGDREHTEICQRAQEACLTDPVNTERVNEGCERALHQPGLECYTNSLCRDVQTQCGWWPQEGISAIKVCLLNLLFPGLIVIFCAIFLFGKCCARRTVYQHATNASAASYCLLVLVICEATLKLVDTAETTDSSGNTVMRLAYAPWMNDVQYKDTRSFGLCLTALFVFAPALFYLHKLRGGDETIVQWSADDGVILTGPTRWLPDFQRSYGYVYSNYDPWAWWFEMTVILRKVLLVILNVQLSGRPVWCATLSFCVFAASLKLQRTFQPYRSGPHVILKETTSDCKVQLLQDCSDGAEKEDVTEEGGGQSMIRKKPMAGSVLLLVLAACGLGNALLGLRDRHSIYAYKYTSGEATVSVFESIPFAAICAILCCGSLWCMCCYARTTVRRFKLTLDDGQTVLAFDVPNVDEEAVLRAPVIRCKHSEDSIVRQQGVSAHATESACAADMQAQIALASMLVLLGSGLVTLVLAPPSESDSCSSGRSFDVAEVVRCTMAVVGLTAAAAPFGYTAWLYCAQKR